MTRAIEPTKGRILVKLEASKYGAVPVPEKTYDTVNSGEVVKVHPYDNCKEWVGKTVFFHDYMDALRIAVLPTGEKLALIKIENIEGTAHEE
jgi:hypothetical protein